MRHFYNHHMRQSSASSSAATTLGKAEAIQRWTENSFREASANPKNVDSKAAVRRRFHESLPNYAVTPLHELPQIAGQLGLARVAVKDESSRLGLPAFKMLGASWATFRALAEQYGEPEVPTLEALRFNLKGKQPVTLVTATDGNHGRAVAKMAKYLGLESVVLIPDVVSEKAINAVRDEGADVRVLRASYDETVQAAALLCGDAGAHQTRLLLQDTAWPGYETVPKWIVDGYATLFDEVSDQLDGGPTLVVVPAGVGSLAHAAVLHCQRNRDWRAVTVEPKVAACITASLAKGEPVTTTPGTTVMAGLNCATPSSLAFPELLSTLDGGVWVTDDEAAKASKKLGEAGIDSGPCGAASLAALPHIASSAAASRLLASDFTVLLLNTEGTKASR